MSQPGAVPSAATSARPRKGDQTRAAIVGAALSIARREGLEGLTIGGLAAQMQMSKSGVFAHFGSREELQRAVLAEYSAHFVEHVLAPAVRKPRGLPRLTALLDNWLALLSEEIEQGCLLIGGSIEYDDRPGLLRDELVHVIRAWTRELIAAVDQAKGEGHLDAAVDAQQLVFEIYGLMLVCHQNARLLHATDSARRARIGLERLLRDARPASESSPRPAATKSSRRSRGAVQDRVS